LSLIEKHNFILSSSTPHPKSLSPTVERGTSTPFSTVGEGLGMGFFSKII